MRVKRVKYIYNYVNILVSSLVAMMMRWSNISLSYISNLTSSTCFWLQQWHFTFYSLASAHICHITLVNNIPGGQRETNQLRKLNLTLYRFLAINPGDLTTIESDQRQEWCHSKVQLTHWNSTKTPEMMSHGYFSEQEEQKFSLKSKIFNIFLH